MRACAHFIGPVFFALAATACGSKTDSTDFFPLEQGRSWIYSVSTAPNDVAFSLPNEKLEIRALGGTTLQGKPAWRRRSGTGLEYWLQADESGVFRVASKSPLDLEPQPDREPRHVLKKPYTVGTEWTATTTAYVLQRRNEVPRELRHLQRYKSLPMKYRIEALNQPVKLPAGDFTGCMTVAGRADIRLYVEEVFAWREVPITTREWYCPGVGLVKVQRVEPSPSKFIVGGTMTLELLAWQ
jgi:hypothetical protein